MFDVNNLTRDQLLVINASLQSDCYVMILCSHCKGNSNIRKLGSVVTKTVIKLDQHEENLKEMVSRIG